MAETKEVVRMVASSVDVPKAPEEAADAVEAVEPLKLSKTYNFEGKQISSLDLSGLENLTTRDLLEINKRASLMGEPSLSVSEEFTLLRTLLCASEATHLPLEFFQGLNLRDAVAVKMAVANFIGGAD